MAVRDYELVLVIRPSADDEAVNATVERTKQFVAERGGSVTHEERWGLRRLAYPIHNFHEGTYVLTRLQMDGDRARELDSMLKFQEDIIRHLLVLPES